MKVRKLEKRLALKKSTVAHLNAKQLNEVKGGVFTFAASFCPQCPPPDKSVRYCPSIETCP